MKRRIIESDDESEDKKPSNGINFKAFTLKESKVSSSEGWVDSRKPIEMTSNERNININRAKTQLKTIKVKASKSKIVYDSDDDNHATPKKHIKIDDNDGIYLVDTPVDKMKSKKTSNINLKIPHKNEVTIVNNAKESDDEDDDDDDDNEMEYENELSQEELENKAKEILVECEKITFNLRKSLNQWQQSDNSNKGDCIDIINIKAQESCSIKQEDIQEYCPTLELKTYQVVGINWLKLLFDNNM